MFRVSGFRLLDFYCFRILELEVLGLRVGGLHSGLGLVEGFVFMVKDMGSFKSWG